jgi:hypothetical protein
MNLVNATRTGKRRNARVTANDSICKQLIHGRFRNAKKYKTCASLSNPDFKSAVNQAFTMGSGIYSKKRFAGTSSMPSEVMKCAQTMANYRNSTAICGGNRYGTVAGLSRGIGPKVGNAGQNRWRQKRQDRGTKRNYLMANKLYGPEMASLREQVIILQNKNKYLESKQPPRQRNAVIDVSDAELIRSTLSGLRAPQVAQYQRASFAGNAKSKKKSKKVARKQSVGNNNNIQKPKLRDPDIAAIMDNLVEIPKKTKKSTISKRSSKVKTSLGRKSVRSLDTTRKNLYDLGGLNYSQNYDEYPGMNFESFDDDGNFSAFNF